MYCGMSLARVGLDFRGLLPPIFEAAIANVFNKVGPVPALTTCLPHRLRQKHRYCDICWLRPCPPKILS